MRTLEAPFPPGIRRCLRRNEAPPQGGGHVGPRTTTRCAGEMEINTNVHTASIVASLNYAASSTASCGCGRLLPRARQRPLRHFQGLGHLCLLAGELEGKLQLRLLPVCARELRDGSGPLCFQPDRLGTLHRLPARAPAPFERYACCKHGPAHHV